MSELNSPDVLDSINLSWGTTLATKKVVTTSGHASGGGDVYCDAGGSEAICEANASAEATATGAATVQIQATGTLFIQNTSSTDVPFVIIDDVFSAFNPGGSDVGASVDNTMTEYASFTSFQSDDGGLLGDSHNCNTDLTVPHYWYGGLTDGGMGAFCGVEAPDASDGETWFGPIPADTTIAADAMTLEIDLFVSANAPPTVPEPLSVSLLAMAIGTLAAVRRTRASSMMTGGGIAGGLNHALRSKS
ncbi:MAG: hypothetical protein J0I21_05685 [Alphaproteobacteria bacterium]|nr:hypothetical protein [Alphaproteobacteria bacterium]